MKHNKTKKTLLGLGTAIAPMAINQLVNAQYITGSILLAISVGCIIGYDYYDDKAKKQPELPEGVDPKAVKEVVELIEEHGPETLDDARKFLNKM